MGGCLFGSAINLINGYNKKEYERLEGNTMPDIIQRLKDAYSENSAKALEHFIRQKGGELYEFLHAGL